MIQIEEVNKTFSGKSGEVHALWNVSLHVEKGDIYGIIGFSGAGKSTLIRLVNGLERPDSGKVVVEGRDLESLGKGKLRFLRRKIGMVFQQFNLLESKTVYHNIALPLILAGLPKAEIGEKVAKVLHFVELEDKKDAHVSQLSGGQKQRVGIARALATDPDLLLCDEATSALDPQTTEAILKLLRRVNREMGVTILLITHQMDVIRMICNKVAVMENGCIVERGRVVDVFGSPQMPVTRRFVRTVVNDRIPESIIRLLHEQTEHYQIDRLKFIGSSVKRPVISDICHVDGIVVNILGATVQELQESVMCVFILQLIGGEEQIVQAEAQIDAAGVLRERVVADEWKNY
ncbi:MAG: ATP-binding cassette domain-containing protein [Clostridiales bacterium]|nr:ATP-binding cassette domain-containing protein [Clostridiales bacterium]